MVFLDAGHGSYHPETGEYVTAPNKQFKHRTGEYHGDGWFYEGVWNRQQLARVYMRLRKLGIPCLIVSHAWKDRPLMQRVEIANWYHRNYMPGDLWSFHANASVSHRGRGYEIYTSPGHTNSDIMASFHYQHTYDLLGSRIRMRPDTSDGDHDKEARFTMLQETIMPAALIEHLFFDQPSDAALLFDEEICELFAEATVRAIIEYHARITV